MLADENLLNELRETNRNLRNAVRALNFLVVIQSGDPYPKEETAKEFIDNFEVCPEAERSEGGGVDITVTGPPWIPGHGPAERSEGGGGRE